MSNGMVYVGQVRAHRGIEKRFKEECSKRKKRTAFENAASANPEHFVSYCLDTAYSRTELDRMEVFYIALHGYPDPEVSYNRAPGGRSNKHHPLAIAKLKTSLKATYAARPELIALRRDHMYALHADPDFKAAAAAGFKSVRNNPEFKSAMLAGISARDETPGILRSRQWHAENKVNCSSQFFGVCFDKSSGKWKASVRIRIDERKGVPPRKVHLGLFVSEEGAAAAVQAARKTIAEDPDYKTHLLSRVPSRKAKFTIVGVHWDKRSLKWQATLRVDGRRLHFGTFATELEAAHRVADAKLMLSQIQSVLASGPLPKD
jgi:hypothetical protein